ncbi:MAG: hypothetical protein M3Z36_09145 [Acidobacteriota bacterium]|nr:hypothetical protein [Acidobacteriota bacterium]
MADPQKIFRWKLLEHLFSLGVDKAQNGPVGLAIEREGKLAIFTGELRCVERPNRLD